MPAPATSARDPRVVRAARLLRDRGAREAEGAVAVDGDDLLAEAARAGLTVEWVLEDHARAEEPAPWRALVDPAVVAPAGPDALRALAALGQPPRAVGLVALPPRPTDLPPRSVVLCGVADEGNMGSIVRTAAALEVPRVVPCGACADPFARRALRASLGAAFTTNLVGAPVTHLSDLRGGPPLAAAVAHGGAPPGALPPDAVVVLGAERDGLAPEDVAACDVQVTIPAPGFESLNVAAAAAILLWELRTPA